jgi:anthraniloyl-CoA monooxygenase
LGSTREFDTFKYFFRMTKYGPMVMHCYQYEPGKSTWICEVPPETMQNAGFIDQPEETYVAELAEIYAEELEGHAFITNRSTWRQFPEVRNKRWVHENIVLIGDAQHTAHFSIGSGTKLAMESSIALFEAFREEFKSPQDVPKVLASFEKNRRDPVEITQHAAAVSLGWFEGMSDHWGQSPEQFAFGLMSRSKQITYDNLALRDEGFVRQCKQWFASQVADAGFSLPAGAPPMFATFKLCDMELANRVVVSPMAQYCAQDGMPDNWHLVHYGHLATGGAGLVYTEMTCPAADARITPGCTGIWNRAQADAWAGIVSFVHENSRAKICMQIGHAGRKGSTRVAWEGMDQPLESGNWPIVSASALKYIAASATPAELRDERMADVVAAFGESAILADQAGFDMIEVHAAHGYLLASFISPLTNKRTDGYGGSIGNRMKFPLAVINAMRAVWPESKPMSVRISACDWAPGGLTEDDLLVACQMIKDAGVDIINVSTGQTVSDEEPVYGRMFQVPFSDRIRSRTGIPTTVAGNISNADQINTIVMSGRADLVALARPHLSEPNLTLHAGAWYGVEDEQRWPKQYHSAMFQSHLLAGRERDTWREMKVALKPPSHNIDSSD